ncbi:hypothetical protein JL720_3789 [Aureococcus anophagefferens]|nr:hypothetical protein JL720_3789 [Aureococcus anophagefferens]
MATFVPLGKAKSFDSRGFASSKKFVPLAASGRANTFTGDEDSMTFLRRRLTRFNASFEGEDAAALRSPSDELAAMVPAHLRGALPWAGEFSVDTAAPLEAGAARLASQLRAFCAGRELALVGVVAGAETGVKLADCLGDAVVAGAWAPGVRSNGAAGVEARRNKWDMGEKVRGAGVRAVRQLRSTGWDADLERWLRDDWRVDPADAAAPVDLIVKPTESAGSDGVTGCKTVGEVVGMWLYDRKPTNGAGFVCHGQRFMAADEPVVGLLVAYAETVLDDALEFRHGPSHMEVKLVPGSETPCLVEVGARCHGAEGFWISVADECAGTNQARAALDAYVDAGAFAALAPLPPAPLLASGTIKFLLVHEDGTLDKIDDAVVRRIKALASYRGYEIFVEAGKKVLDDYAFLDAICLPGGGLWTISA